MIKRLDLEILEAVYVKTSKEEDGNVINLTHIKGVNGKITFTIEDNGYHRICAKNTRARASYGVNKVAMKLIINSDNMDEPDIKSSVQKADVSPVQDKMAKIIYKVNNTK